MPSLHPAHDRAALRARLLSERKAWIAGPAAHAAAAALAPVLRDLLAQLEPQCLGLYWPLEGEFNPRPACAGLGLAADHESAHAAEVEADAGAAPGVPRALPLALPFARRDPKEMSYRRWDGAEPAEPGLRDECGIPSSAGAVVVPDVVLVPCVGFTREGYRLGYGGGYFDRWLARHPGVTSIGIAWSQAEVQFAIEPHDRALTLLLTPAGLMVPD